VRMDYGETRGPTRGVPAYTRGGRPGAKLSSGRCSYSFPCGRSARLTPRSGVERRADLFL